MALTLVFQNLISMRNKLAGSQGARRCKKGRKIEIAQKWKQKYVDFNLSPIHSRYFTFQCVFSLSHCPSPCCDVGERYVLVGDGCGIVITSFPTKECMSWTLLLRQCNFSHYNWSQFKEQIYKRFTFKIDVHQLNFKHCSVSSAVNIWRSYYMIALRLCHSVWLERADLIVKVVSRENVAFRIHTVIIHALRKLKHTLGAASGRIVCYFGGFSLTLTWEMKKYGTLTQKYAGTLYKKNMAPIWRATSMWFIIIMQQILPSWDIARDGWSKYGPGDADERNACSSQKSCLFPRAAELKNYKGQWVSDDFF